MHCLLLSDLHYTSNLTPEAYSALHPGANLSLAAGDAFGYTQEGKLAHALSDILREHKKKPLDAVFLLGDLSVDDYPFRHLAQNYCELFRREFLEKLPCPFYVLPGNHDSYPDEEWTRAVGTPRQYTVTVNGCAFAMMDTFGSLTGISASGSGYSGIDTGYLLRTAKENEGKPLFVCTHSLDENNTQPELAALLEQCPNLVCFFRGHSHKNGLFRLCGKPLFDIGGYAYNGTVVNGTYVFSVFDPLWAWGYQILDVNEDNAVTWHHKPALLYCGSNGIFDFPGETDQPTVMPLH